MTYAILTVVLGIVVVTLGIITTTRAARESAEIMRRLDQYVK